jgi:hypothetical protein
MGDTSLEAGPALVTVLLPLLAPFVAPDGEMTETGVRRAAPMPPWCLLVLFALVMPPALVLMGPRKEAPLPELFPLFPAPSAEAREPEDPLAAPRADLRPLGVVVGVTAAGICSFVIVNDSPDILSPGLREVLRDLRRTGLVLDGLVRRVASAWSPTRQGGTKLRTVKQARTEAASDRRLYQLRRFLRCYAQRTARRKCWRPQAAR